MSQYDDIIQQAASAYNVDPNLIRGVIGTESNGKPGAVSNKGAVGLMQIEPSNYKSLGITDPTDPQQNIMGGTKLLAGLLDKYGDVPTALRHYQGGNDTTQWGPVNAAYPSKVFAAGGITMPQQNSSTLPGIPTDQTQGNQSDDAIFSAFTKGAAPTQQPTQGPNDDQILAAFTKAPASAAQPVAQPQQPAATQPAAQQPGMLESFAAGLGHGFGSTVLGAQQLLGHGLEAAGHIGESPTLSGLITGQQPMNALGRAGQWLVNDANQGLQNLNGQYSPYSQAHSIAAGAGNFGGSVAATLPLGAIAPEAATLGGAVKQGAIMGGLTSAAAPVDPNSQNYWGSKAGQVAGGIATGGVLGPAAYGLGRLVSPNISPDVQTLLDKGVTPTPGQILGGGFASTESKLTSIPVLGDMIRNAQQRAVGQFNVAAYNDALAPIGEKFDSSVSALGQEGIAQVQKKIGDAYDTILPQMQMKVDPQFQSDITNLGQMAQSLPESQQKTFMNVLKTQIFDKLGPQGDMDGQTLKGVQSELANTSAGYLKDPSFDNRQLGAAVSSLRDAVDSNLARVNPPELGDQLANANQAWANFARLRTAASSQGAMNNEGIFTAAQLQNAVRGADKSVGKGATATGGALMQDLSGAGQRVLGSKYPDSGTVGRGLMTLLAPGSVAAGMATAPVSTLATLGGIGLGALPYTQLGQRAAATLLTARPQFTQPIGNAIAQFGPRVVAGGLPALLSGGQ